MSPPHTTSETTSAKPGAIGPGTHPHHDATSSTSDPWNPPPTGSGSTSSPVPGAPS